MFISIFSKVTYTFFQIMKFFYQHAYVGMSMWCTDHIFFILYFIHLFETKDEIYFANIIKMQLHLLVLIFCHFARLYWLRCMFSWLSDFNKNVFVCIIGCHIAFQLMEEKYHVSWHKFSAVCYVNMIFFYTISHSEPFRWYNLTRNH